MHPTIQVSNLEERLQSEHLCTRRISITEGTGEWALRWRIMNIPSFLRDDLDD
jgi:hypothetical protein